MNEMIERVARVICRAEFILRFGETGWRPGEIDKKVDEYWWTHEIAASAAIRAMRDPTEAMVTAGWAEAFARGPILPTETGITAQWKAMIDAALAS